MAPTNFTVGSGGIRGENIERAIKGYAEQMYKLKQVCVQVSSANWTESYYAEDATVLTGKTGSAVTGIPRGAQFPNLEPNWTKKSAPHVKYGGEGTVFMEDRMTDAIDVQARTIKRVAQAVAYAVDTAIHTGISGATGVNTVGASATWDNATIALRDPIGDILHGIEYCAVDDYDILEGGYLLLHPEDYTNLLMNTKVINNPSFKTADVVSNGKVGQICGLTIIRSRAITANQPVMIKYGSATWKAPVKAITSALISEPGIKTVIRAWEVGQLQVTDPEGIHVITAA